MRLTTYSDGTPVHLGDKVNVRIFFRRFEGRVVYVPGLSPPHREMEMDGLMFVGIRVEGKAKIGATVDPESGMIKKSIRFLGRDTDGQYVEFSPDEEIFEDKVGNPL